MDRETVIIPEKKAKIENIKQKYNNLSMSDKNANKIKSLEVANNILKTASMIVGIVGVIDIFIPDPIAGLDEAALMAISGLLKGVSSMCENKIDEIANSADSSIKMSEVEKLSSQLTAAAKAVDSSRKTHNH